MQIQSIDITGYRSLRDLNGQLDRVTVLVGPNGVGKSNLYRALQLIHSAADRQLASAIAAEGGMDSVRWAGEKSKNIPTGIKIKIGWDELEYEIHIGIERQNEPFPQDPFVKTEKIWSTMGKRVLLTERAGPQLKHRDDEGRWQAYPHQLAVNESMLNQLREPNRFPDILRVRMAVMGWRFYHTFRTDPDSPLRRQQPVYRTPLLESDGSNMVASLMSIQHGRNSNRFAAVIQNAFPGSGVSSQSGTTVTFRELMMRHPSIRRKMTAAEMSDGTLRFFALAVALFNEEPPDFLVLNEPETSLHESTFGALADAIQFAAERSQVLIVTHSRSLADAIADRYPTTIRTLRWEPRRGTKLDTQIPIED